MTALHRWIAVGFLGSVVVLAGAADERSTPGKEPSSAERLQTVLERAEANDPAAIPQLIALLGELPADECKTIEEYLTQLAGPWLPTLSAADNSASARKSRRDAWRKWWRSGDGTAQLAAIQQHVPTPELRHKTKTLIEQLGDDEFAVREKAQRELLRLGRRTLPQLRQAKTSSDPETVRRARDLVERLESDAGTHLPRAAARLLALHKPKGAATALLSYLPFAEEDGLAEETQAALTELALSDGKPDAGLLRALDDESSLIRAAAGEALAQGGGREGRKAVRKLLTDKVPSVRLRIARALVRLGEKDGVPVLIELLAVLPEAQIGEAEELLYQLAGDAPPQMPAADDKNKETPRDVWAAWWKANASRSDLTFPQTPVLLGYTVFCNANGNRIWETDRRGNVRWKIDKNLQGPLDVRLLPGERVLIAEWGGHRVTERDKTGKILWELTGIHQPANVQRLPNGNTFIALHGGSILEVNRAKKEIYKIANVPGVQAAYRTRQGRIVCLTQNKECLILDRGGKQLSKFPLKYQLNYAGCLDVTADGRILVAATSAGKVMEYNSQGQLLHEWNVPSVITATSLPGSRVLCSKVGSGVVEIDRTGKVVWEDKTARAYRTRRR